MRFSQPFSKSRRKDRADHRLPVALGIPKRVLHAGRGNEKGGVEEGLGWYRRNFLVPVPEAGDLAALNELLLARCVEGQSHTISGRSTTMGAEMEQERPCLLPLAEESFELEETLFPVLARSPINCLIVEAGAGPIAEAARADGKTVLETNSLAAAPLSKINWGAAGSRVVISGLFWPRMKLSRRGGGDDSEAGPTGAPWIDSKSWVARLAAVRAPGKPVWLHFEPDPKEPYLRSICRAAGGSIGSHPATQRRFIQNTVYAG